MVNITQLEISNNSTNVTDDSVNSTSEIDYCDGYRNVDFLLRNIWMYAGYPILALGTVGHLLVIFLVLLNKRLRSLPLSVFLIIMSASGLMALYAGLLPTIIKHHTCHNERLEDQTTETGCRMYMAAIYFSLQLYSWMEASVAVERMCAVRWSLACRKLSTRSVKNIALACIIIALLSINGIHFKIIGMSRGTCEVENHKLFKAWQYIHSVLYIIFPVAVMLPANAVTLHTIYRSPLRNSNNVKKAKPVAIMMFILNGIFVVTTTPILVADYEHLEASDYDAVLVAWSVSRLMMYLGCSLTFLVYVAVAARFRRALSDLLISGKKKIYSALAAMSHISASQHKAAAAEGCGDHRASPSDPSATVQAAATSIITSTTDEKA